MPSREPRRSGSITSRYISVALISCALLVFEITVTRILSVILWYHWAFLSVSLAMLGLGAPGVWFSVTREPRRYLAPFLYASAVLPALAVALIFKVGAIFQGSTILFCLACLIPAYLALGGAICLFLLEAPGRGVSRMYGFDLLGAFTGALCVVPLMRFVPTPHIAAALGFLALGAVFLTARRVTAAGVVAGLLLAAALAWGEPFALRYSKKYDERERPPLYERWTPTARLTFHDNQDFASSPGRTPGPFGWGWGSKMVPVHPEQYRIFQDGGAATPITRLGEGISEHAYLLYDVTTAGYQLRHPGRVGIIGAGGGRDILTSLVAGARHVDAIELHGEIISEVSDRFKEFSGDVYHLPGVAAFAGDGRSVLTRSPPGYDLIQISMIDSWAATAAGAFALSENNLYTVEAYRLYWSKLSATGIVSTSRWMAGPEGAELPRLILMIREALIEEGIPSPEDHVAVLQGRRVATVLVSKPPFSADDIRRLAEIADERGFLFHYPPADETRTPGPIAALLSTGTIPAGLEKFDLDPPVDDRPFFFQVLDPFSPVHKDEVARLGVNSEAVYALQLLMAAMVVVTILLFFLPFVLGRWLVRTAGFWQGSGFFAAIGIGFMLVEIPWLQRFVLYLGHPSPATTVVLACLLMGAGEGAILSAKLPVSRMRVWGWAAPILLAATNLAMSWVFPATLGWPFGVRVLVSAALLIPNGVLMGLFFPIGMIRFGDRGKAWFWAVNGAMGVLASVFSLALAMRLGFTRVTLIGVALYLLAVLLLFGKSAGEDDAADGVAAEA